MAKGGKSSKSLKSRAKKSRRPAMLVERRAASGELTGFVVGKGGSRAKKAIGAPARPTRESEGFRTAARYLADGLVDVDAVVKEFGLTKGALAQSLGFSEDTLQRFSRVNAPKTQQRLRELLEIIHRVEPWAGGRMQAMAWYRSQSIPSLGGQTAEALVQQDRASIVRAYLDTLAVGAFA